MKKKVKLILAGAAVIVLAAVGLYVLLSPVPVETEIMEEADLTETFTASSTVTPKNSQYVCAPLAGQVTEILLKEGETASTGDQVVAIDDSEARDELERQKTSLEAQKAGVKSQGNSAKAEVAVSRQQLETQLNQARTTYEQLYGENGNAEQLFQIASENFQVANVAYWKAYDKYDGSNDPTKQSQLSALESTRAAAEQALVEADTNRSESTKAYYESMIASYENQLKLLDGSSSSLTQSTKASEDQLSTQEEQVQSQLDKADPTAPLDGVIWEMLVKNGDYVAANQPLYRIYDPSEMTLEADLLDTQAALIHDGDEVTAELSDGSIMDATVSFLSPVSTEELSVLGIEENRSKVILTVDGLSDRIGAGHQADLTFHVVHKEQVLQVPSSAIVPDTNGDAVYVKEGSCAVLTLVETGEQSDGRTEIVSGLEEGEEVITNPYDVDISDGKRVK